MAATLQDILMIIRMPDRSYPCRQILVGAKNKSLLSVNVTSGVVATELEGMCDDFKGLACRNGCGTYLCRPLASRNRRRVYTCSQSGMFQLHTRSEAAPVTVQRRQMGSLVIEHRRFGWGTMCGACGSAQTIPRSLPSAARSVCSPAFGNAGRVVPHSCVAGD